MYKIYIGGCDCTEEHIEKWLNNEEPDSCFQTLEEVKKFWESEDWCYSDETFWFVDNNNIIHSQYEFF